MCVCVCQIDSNTQTHTRAHGRSEAAVFSGTGTANRGVYFSSSEKLYCVSMQQTLNLYIQQHTHSEPVYQSILISTDNGIIFKAEYLCSVISHLLHTVKDVQYLFLSHSVRDRIVMFSLICSFGLVLLRFISVQMFRH